MEDEEVNFLYLETILKKIIDKTEIIQASSGEEAVKLCTQNQPINLILMDIKLPGQNGIETTKQIKQIYPKIPVIAQTSFTASFDLENSSFKVFDGYIRKPIRKDELVKVLETYLFVKKES